MTGDTKAVGAARPVRGRARRRALTALLSSGLLAGALTAVVPGVDAPHASAAATAGCPWVTSDAPIPARVAQLLGAMSLSQKIGMINLNVGSGYENVTPAVPSLCIPALTLQDGPAGVTAGAGAGPDGSGTATQLPAPEDLAASFDPTLARAYGTVLGTEAAAKGIDVVQGPDVNIARIPQAGRDFEVLGEDPYLTSQTAVAEIDGIQATGTMADVKHFVAYNQETNRGTQTGDNSIVSTRALEEIYFPAFQAAVQEARVASVMCSYNMVNGVNACQDATLLQDTLDTQWGFAGFVRSDLGAVWDQSVALSSGLDQFKPSAAAAIAAGVTNGSIQVSSIDAAVGRILTEMFRFGTFTRSLTGNAGTFASTPADQAVGTQVAEEGSVLLQNTGGALPLSRRSGSVIQVLGEGSGAGVETGPTPGSSGYVEPTAVVTPCEGLTAAEQGAVVRCDSGWDPTSAADAQSQAEAEAAEAATAGSAVIFVNDPAGEGADLTSLELPDYQDILISTVAAQQPDTTVVINSGNPVTMAPWLSSVRGVVEDWYGGQSEGTAIAALLFGDVDFSGKLPITFPTSTSLTPTSSAAQFPGIDGQVQYAEGIDVGYRGYEADGITPEFPFGYGLSYTSFAFSPLSLSATAVTNDTFAPDPPAGRSPELLSASMTVTNTGAVAGADVAQLYVDDPAATGEQRQLIGYQRVQLAPGQSQTVTFPVDARALSTYDTRSGDFVVADGTYTLSGGDSSASPGLATQAQFVVTRSVGSRFATVFPPATAAAGTTVRVRTYFHNDGDETIFKPHFFLRVPSGWKVTTTWKPVSRLAPHATVRRIFSVAVPVRAQGTTATFTAQLRYATSARSVANRILLSPAGSTTFGPVVTTTTQTLVVDPGASHPTKVHFANPNKAPVRVYWSASTGPGVTIRPSSGTALVFHQGRTIYLNIRTTPATAPGYAPITLSIRGTVKQPYTRHVEVVVKGHVTYKVVHLTRLIRYYLPGAGIGLTVAYPSIDAAFNDVGVTAADPSAGDYDTYGNSYSASALASFGISPGATVVAGGHTFTWPSEGPEVPDEVLSGGQTVAFDGSGPTLGVLGSATGGDALGRITVIYTDGTTSSYTMRLTDWTAAGPDGADQLAAGPMPENRSDGGAPAQVNLYEDNVPLVAGRTVAQVVLPTPSPNRTMHIFALSTQ